MYKYGISYYEVVEGARVPVSDLTVKLVRPGGDWAIGLVMTESLDASGYYEIAIDDAEDCGFYEIWDDQVNPSGSFSGKTCLVGQMDARGIQNGAIYGNHILAGAVTESKIAANAVSETHLKTTFTIPLSKITHEAQAEEDGVGGNSSETPPTSADATVEHFFDGDYEAMPTILLTPRTKIGTYIANASITDKKLTLIVGIWNPDETTPLYDILVVP